MVGVGVASEGFSDCDGPGTDVAETVIAGMDVSEMEVCGTEFSAGELEVADVTGREVGEGSALHCVPVDTISSTRVSMERICSLEHRSCVFNCRCHRLHSSGIDFVADLVSNLHLPIARFSSSSSTSRLSSPSSSSSPVGLEELEGCDIEGSSSVSCRFCERRSVRGVEAGNGCLDNVGSNEVFGGEHIVSRGQISRTISGSRGVLPNAKRSNITVVRWLGKLLFIVLR